MIERSRRSGRRDTANFKGRALIGGTLQVITGSR